MNSVKTNYPSCFVFALGAITFLHGLVAAAEPTEETRTAGEDFRQNAQKLPTVWLEDTAGTCLLELGIVRWGSVRGGASQIRISVPERPSFVTAVRFSDGETISFSSAETQKTARVAFDVTKGSSRIEGTMVIQLEAVDETVRPRRRTFTIPFNHEVRPASKVVVHPIRDDAPEKFPVVDAIDFCDTDEETLYPFDRVAIFFTPAINLDPPLEGKDFLWRVYGSDGKVFAGGEARVPSVRGTLPPSLPFSRAGSPGTFVWVGDLAGVHPAHRAFTVETTPALAIPHPGPGFGSKTLLVPREGSDREQSVWQGEGSFAVVGTRLGFRGFLLEQADELLLRDPRLAEGRTRVRARVQGTRVTLSAGGEWSWAEAGGQRGVPRGSLQRVSSELELEFPAELDLSADVLGEVRAVGRLPDRSTLRGTARGFDVDLQVRTFAYGMRPLTPIVGAVTRNLLEADGPEPWGTLESGRATLRPADPQNLFAATRGGERSRSVQVRGGGGRERCGLPGRRPAWHLRDDQVAWLLPVCVSLCDVDLRSETSTPVSVVWGFAIYSRSSEDGGAADLVRPSVPSSLGDVGPGQRPLDPNDPDMSALIAEWVAVARPPENALYGGLLRYSEWGRVFGTTASGKELAQAKPPSAEGQTAPEYLWATGQALDSIDHCTLGEYVRTRLEGDSVTHCAGRYRLIGETPGLASSARDFGRQGDARALAEEALDELVERSGSDTSGAPRVHVTEETLGARSAPDGPELDHLRSHIEAGQREEALETMELIAGGMDERLEVLLDELLEEQAVAKAFEEAGRGLEVAGEVDSVPDDEAVLERRGVPPGRVTGEIAGSPQRAPVDAGEFLLPPSRDGESDGRPAPADSGSSTDPAAAVEEVVARVLAEQRDVVVRERGAVRDVVVAHPVSTRGGMEILDVGEERSVRLSVWSSDGDGGDRVWIAVGGRVLSEELTLTNARRSFTLTLDEVFTTVSVVALGEGNEPRNRATLEVSVAGKAVSTQWDLATDEMGCTVIRRLP